MSWLLYSTLQGPTEHQALEKDLIKKEQKEKPADKIVITLWTSKIV